MPTIATGGLCTIKRTTARWENDAVCPAEHYQLLLAPVFAEHGGSVLLGPGSDFDRLMTAFAHHEIKTGRICELRDLTAAALTRGGAARLAFENCDDASSADYYAEALAAAGRLPDSRQRAAVRTSQAMVTLYAIGDKATTPEARLRRSRITGFDVRLGGRGWRSSGGRLARRPLRLRASPVR